MTVFSSRLLRLRKRKKGKRFVLIIDEINRGNIAKIFGELITLIEDSRRLGADDETKVTLPYSKDSFGVPNNLYLIGTMNTADRSIQLLDTALRRRFDFIEMMPKPEIISDNVEGVNCKRMLKAMNKRITALLDREHQIGHTYLLDIDTMEKLSYAFQNKIFPLLQEYFFDDWAKIRAVLGGNSFVAEQSAAGVLRENEQVDEDRTIYERLPGDDDRWTDLEEYKKIYNAGNADDTSNPNDRHHTVREYEPLDFVTAQEREELKSFQGVFKQNSNGTLTASNYVGVITTKRGTVVEILPKIDLGGDPAPHHEKTKRLFLSMLRCWRGFDKKTLPESDIRALRRFPMLEVFVRQFLVNLNANSPVAVSLDATFSVEENLPYLGGRILFHEQIRENLINQARFYVAHDELSVNRPANRLIHSAMAKLTPQVRRHRKPPTVAPIDGDIRRRTANGQSCTRTGSGTK